MRNARPLQISSRTPIVPVPVLLGASAAGLAVCLLSALALSLPLRGVLVAGAGFAGLAGVLGLLMRARYPHGHFGACNLVTLIRAAIVCTLAGALAGGMAAGWAVAALATLALALDGVDGWLARRHGLASGFGARFDVEVDSALALILSLHVLAGSAVGAEVLVLGLMRYVYVAAGWVLPWLRAALPPSQRRRVICVIQLGVLIALLTPWPDAAQAIWLARAAAVALIWSFAVDIRTLHRMAR
ncbi:MAG: CDP-alcohol phosphatidyltransferase family protein [Paracoccus sp. (in: a-proteobacteria)]|uniref:CDP-alcohol phosphatidyltransferase family protein n=1 Tax=Paracoccus sp. TaxID=267 RepID=UPI00391ADF62